MSCLLPLSLLKGLIFSLVHGWQYCVHMEFLTSIDHVSLIKTGVAKLMSHEYVKILVVVRVIIMELFEVK